MTNTQHIANTGHQHPDWLSIELRDGTYVSASGSGLLGYDSADGFYTGFVDEPMTWVDADESIGPDNVPVNGWKAVDITADGDFDIIETTNGCRIVVGEDAVSLVLSGRDSASGYIGRTVS